MTRCIELEQKLRKHRALNYFYVKQCTIQERHRIFEIANLPARLAVNFPLGYLMGFGGEINA